MKQVKKMEKVKKMIEAYKEEIKAFEEYADLYEVYDHPVLYIGHCYDCTDYDLYINYTRAIPDYIEVVKEYDYYYSMPTVEEVYNDLKGIENIES